MHAPPDSTIAEPQPDAGTAAGSAVEDHLAAFDFDLATVRRDALASLQAELFQPLTEAVQRAADRHAQLRRTAGLDDVPGSDGTVTASRHALWRGVRAYLRGLRTDVLEPLRGGLETLKPAPRLAAAKDQIRQRAAECAAAAPESITRLLPAGTYHAHTGDGVVRRLRKWMIRFGDGFADLVRGVRNPLRRLIRRPALVREPVMQTVPLRELLGYHTRVRIEPELESQFLRLRQRLAREFADVERSLTSGFAAVLAADRLLDDPAFHTGEAAAESEAPGPADSEAVPDWVEDLQKAATAAESVGTAVERLAGLDLVEDVAARLDERIAMARHALLDDVARIDTFMLGVAARPAMSASATTRPDVTEQWSAWFDQLGARIRLARSVALLREQLLASLDECIRSVTEATMELVAAPLLQCRDETAAVREELVACCIESRETADAAKLRDSLETLAERIEAIVEARLDPRAAGVQDRIRQVSEDNFSRISTALAELPESLTLHPLPPEEGRIDPMVRPIRVRPRDAGAQAFDALVLERVRTASQPIPVVLDQALGEVHGLETVIRFHVDAAKKELDEPPAEGGGGLEGAEELTINGLDRAIEGMTAQHDALLSELPGFAQRLFEASARGWSQFEDRVRVEDRMQEQILDVRYRMSLAVREAWHRAVTDGRRAWQATVKGGVEGWKRLQALIRMGQSAVAGERVTDEEQRRTIDTLSKVEETLGGLPLVYRRLFTFDPVEDREMLVGREADLEAAASHYENWRIGLTDALILTGSDGNGRTSFVNVVAKEVLEDAVVHRLKLTERVVDERAFARQLADVLGIPGDDIHGLADLTRSIQTRPPARQPVACIIENMEHLLLRTPSGNGLIGPTLAFLSRTDSRIYWIGLLAEQAWLYVEKAETASARLVRQYSLTKFGRAEIEAVIMSRHARSGLKLHFEPPPTMQPILRRKLARAPGPVERTEILRSDYFDRLVRFTGQNLLLALLQWLRSVSPDAESSTLQVHPMQPLSFSYLDAFSMDQSFTLKAFMEHATLTLEEHDRIFSVGREQSRQLFEHLGNLLLIEPADARERMSRFSFSTIDEERRYRLRPAIIHPVLVHLRSRNLVP